jgi:TolB-like protein/Flp pilus assembly protein TadD
MGEVYRARDSKLKRNVAVKVLPQSLSSDADALARFEREALAVAALSHPNILAIFDFGTHEGTAYSVTELLEGETLRGKLAVGPIPQKQAVDYALQVAKGLSAAHEKGIVHRDLKPENLFVSRDGHVKILDFGLAKKVEAATPEQQTSAPTGSGDTEPGTVLGTMGYMSPEQVRGLPVDHRSDIFSFGAILYEMLSGRKAFKKDTASDTMAAIMRDEPPELTQSGRNVSPALDHIVRHCLEKDRENRFQSARDVAFALSEALAPTTASGAQPAAPRTVQKRVLIAAAAIVVLALAGIFLLRRTHEGAGQAGGVKRVAVLPFENLGAPEDDYFADGMADEIRGKLTSLPGLQVIARASSTPYKKTTKTPQQIARELDAQYLLTATVRWQKGGGGNRVHVSPELIEVSGPGTPTSKWQQPFDATLTDVFGVQSDIAAGVVQALGVALGAREERQLSGRPTQNLAAYDAFLRGEEASQSMGVLDALSLRRAIDLYERAVALDPGFARAWAQLARASSVLYQWGTPTSALAERARQAAERARTLAPNLPETFLALGEYQRYVLEDADGALKLHLEGRRHGPGNADLLTAVATAELSLGHWDSCIRHLRESEGLDPRSVRTKNRLGFALLLLRRFSEARDAFDHGLALAPADISLIAYKAETFLAQGDLAGARAVLRAAAPDLEPTALVSYVATSGDLVWVLDDEEQKLLVRLLPSAFDGDRGVWGLCLAQAYALRDDVASTRSYAKEATKAFEEQLRSAPQSALVRSTYGVALAYLSRKEDAIREGQRATLTLPIAKSAYSGAYVQHQLARIYILVGEPEKALDQLEPLLKIPYNLSPGWLKIDPNFDPLRKNPRFQKLVAIAK